MKKVFITGAAGFIGFHLSKLLLSKGHKVYGYDGMTNYYDPRLKKSRNNILDKYSNFEYSNSMIENKKVLENAIEKFQPDFLVHLAAQAGVRYSIENPDAYIKSNIIGTFNILEISKKINIKHLLMASTSSVYGANSNLPFSETEKTDLPLTLYAATKKSNESMAHSYSYLWKLPITMLRFFTVYGPWGRPDMALFNFVEKIINGKRIEVFNNGEMYRDFTYVEDLAKAIYLLIDVKPNDKTLNKSIKFDSLSSVAPYRVVNIGNSEKVSLLNFIEAIEDTLSIKAKRKNLPMQMGDIPETLSNTNLLKTLIGFTPNTNYKEGIRKFIQWYIEYYNV